MMKKSKKKTDTKDKETTTLETILKSLSQGDTTYANFGYYKKLPYSDLVTTLGKSKLDFLSLEGSDVGPVYFGKICDVLEKSNIKKLVLDRNSVDLSISKALGALLSNNNTIEKLSLAQCKINDKVLLEIVKGLKNNKSLKSLNLDQNEFTEKASKSLCETLGKKQKSLTHLSLRENTLNTAAASLSSLLSTTSNLISLNLSFCEITDEALADLVTPLAENKSLKNLDLRGNRISDRGAAELSDIISSNATLLNLFLQYNEIGDQGLGKILKALEENIGLEVLDVCGNVGDDSLEDKIWELVEKNRDEREKRKKKEEKEKKNNEKK
eukprot:TRINITY_DN5026_c0_g1_i1.p1 TRINITY_DN5026_c0_g1~~TRINITY_DN5026_c0_g1_i1.p1  ORF type:complete len:326 (-),score=64.97 TRINITY_DN5026_c0_g1_i1:156-1133(-)